MSDITNLRALQNAQDSFRIFGEWNGTILQSELAQGCVEGNLAGQIVGLKANIAVKGAKWTAGLAARDDIVADHDAFVTRRLRENGARVLPGLNMDAAALGGGTDNPEFGRTLNPHARERSSGGSSGGSAAAVASGVLNIALGTDTLGSIRIPASYCGVFGLKPTLGLVGRTGIVPLAPSFDTVGPITARAKDLWRVLSVIAGADPDDTASRCAFEMELTDPPVARADGFRIGIPRQITSVTCEPEVMSVLDRTKQRLVSEGAEVVEIDMPGWRPNQLRKSAFLVTEAEGAVEFSNELKQGDSLPPQVQAMLSYGANMGAQKLVLALHELARARAELDRTFQSVDVLLMPTTPQRAFRAVENPPPNQADFTALANVGGNPAVAVPVWHSHDPLPSSVQLLGPAWSEAALIGLAALLETSVSPDVPSP